MSFSHIKTISFASLTDKVINLNHLIDDQSVFSNLFKYKVDIIKNKSIELIGTYKINVTNNLTNEQSIYPEKGLLIELHSGTYKLIYKSGHIINLNTNEINSSITSSKGNIILDTIFKNNDNYILSNYNQFQFKISKNEKFSIWINGDESSNLIGEIEFDIVKISNSKLNMINQKIDSSIFDLNTISMASFKLDKNYDYLFEIYQFKDEVFTTPIFKYPSGTYEITLNSKVYSSSNNTELENLILTDKSKFNIIGGKISNFNNIKIPSNVNPINYYYMIGKIEYLVYLNFINDSYYFEPCATAECFMALYIPESKCQIIEETQNYITFKVTSYQLIHSSFTDKNSIINNFASWLKISNNDVNSEQYELFYWANIENHDSMFFYNDLKKYIEIENYFSYVKFYIEGYIYDNVSLPITNELNENFFNDMTGLGFDYSSCRYEVVEKVDNVNFIDWNDQINWSNYNNLQNILKAPINGEGIFKISKQRFKNITNIDLNEFSNGILNIIFLDKFGINKPDVSPFNRFQYWLRTDKF